MAVKKRAVDDHADALWICKRIGGRGGSYTHSNANPESLSKIYYIGGTSRVVIWFYNFQLLIRYCKRQLKRRRGG